MPALYGDERRGQPPYDPSLMTKLLVYGYVGRQKFCHTPRSQKVGERMPALRRASRGRSWSTHAAAPSASSSMLAACHLAAMSRFNSFHTWSMAFSSGDLPGQPHQFDAQFHRQAQRPAVGVSGYPVQQKPDGGRLPVVPSPLQEKGL